MLWFSLFSLDASSHVTYYSTALQLQQLLTELDVAERDAALAKALNHLMPELVRQMNITSQLTTKRAGTATTYLQSVDGSSQL